MAIKIFFLTEGANFYSVPGHDCHPSPSYSLDTPRSVGLLWTSDQPDTETFCMTTHNIHNRQTDRQIPPTGFEATIPASERPQIDALDRVDTGIGNKERVLAVGFILI